MSPVNKEIRPQSDFKMNKTYTIEDIEKVPKFNGEVRKSHITRLTAPGENFLSLVFKVDFEVDDGTVSTVVKRVPATVKFGPVNINAMAMQNEIRWYSEMVPLMQEFGKEFGIDTEFYPEYIGSRLSLDATQTKADDESMLILKNLIPEGYKNEDRYIGFDLLTSKAVLKTLVNFHAAPLAMKFKRPDMYRIFKDFLDSCRPKHDKRGPPDERDGPRGPPDHSKLIDKMMEIPACQPYKEKLEKLRAKKMGPPSLDTTCKEPWSAVAHNDFWVNNIMVKQREGDAPLVKMVDFQFCSLASYAKDLVFFLLTSVRNDIQRQHFDDLLRFYYDHFTAIFERLDISELKLTYEDFLEEVKRTAMESETHHAIFFSTIIFGEKGTGPDVLTGEVDMMDHMDCMMQQMNEHRKEKLGLIAELTGSRDWL